MLTSMFSVLQVLTPRMSRTGVRICYSVVYQALIVLPWVFCLNYKYIPQNTNHGSNRLAQYATEAYRKGMIRYKNKFKLYNTIWSRMLQGTCQTAQKKQNRRLKNSNNLNFHSSSKLNSKHRIEQKLYLSVKPCSLGETHRNKGTHKIQYIIKRLRHLH